MPSIRIPDIDSLLAGCLREEKHAQHALYDLFSSRVMAICRRYAYSRFEADDIFQEAFISIYKGIKSYDREKGDLEHWIYRIAVNCALKHIQKYNRNNFTDIQEIHESSPEQVTLDDSLTVKELMSLIDELPIGKKVVFNLYAIEGYSHREIAEMLSISEGTSKSQLSKAKEMLVKLHNSYYAVGDKTYKG